MVNRTFEVRINDHSIITVEGHYIDERSESVRIVRYGAESLVDGTGVNPRTVGLFLLASIQGVVEIEEAQAP